ncbi:S-layer homology domain-containing protein [Herbivorax sp. ANBcel31]|uniref:S-layer homology domain-containing protein n=1 Tax=Herbivorax sp. ANBcel31 TaxID=3069754 RepID=UPI0027B7097C|nr:S-layer homology domain-containing protein [Herbivorax sp. ANBcel31]MDQ2087129.1 S-layer homology domain-containing protein [Herbivorax sp. ANBcel31]
MKLKKISFIYICILIAVTLTSILFSNSLTFASGDMEIKVSTVQGKPGDTVEVPVKFLNVPDSGINNCDFMLNYDQNVLEVDEVRAGSIITNPGVNLGLNTRNLGKIATMFVDETGLGKELIKTDGEFLIIVFKIKSSADDGVSYVDLESMGAIANYELETIPLNFTKGGVKVSDDSSTIITDKDKESDSDKEDSDQIELEETEDLDKPEDLVPGSKEGIHKAYLSGYPDGNFKPENNITRAEAAVIFANLLEVDKNTQSKSDVNYTDLSGDHWATWAVEHVSDLGLFTGYPDGTFKPNNSITRAEFSTVVFKFMELEEPQQVKNKFDDSVGHWAQKYIEKLSKHGYINGYPDDTFKPQANIKRAESVALINRALDRGPLYEVEENFPDVPDTYWAYGDIAKGAIDHSYYVDEEGREVFLEKLND